MRGEAFCNPDEAGHDYRVGGAIYDGSHTGGGVSEEVHLPCDLSLFFLFKTHWQNSEQAFSNPPG